jgi:hypothetical protein
MNPIMNRIPRNPNICIAVIPCLPYRQDCTASYSALSINAKFHTLLYLQTIAPGNSATIPGNLKIILSLILFFPDKDGDIPCLSQAPERDKSHLFWGSHTHEMKYFSQGNLCSLDQLEAGIG